MMASLLLKTFNTALRLHAATGLRSISIGCVMHLKEIKTVRDGTTLTIQGLTVPSPRENMMVKVEPEGKKCYMCSSNLDVKHTDVLILSQFVRWDGCMLPRRITKLCKMQQKKIGTMVTMAQKAGLMINLTPLRCKRDPTKRRKEKQFNTYYDEKTIFEKKKIPFFDRLRYRRKIALSKLKYYR